MFLSEFSQLTESSSTFVLPDGASVTALKTALDCRQRAGGAPVWRPAVLSSWAGAVQDAFEARELDAGQASGRYLLSSDQEIALWQRVIAECEAERMSTPELAAPIARQAWQLSQLWDAQARSNEGGAEDQLALERWSAAWRRRCDEIGATDVAAVLAGTGTAELPLRGRPHGFAVMPPRLAAHFDHATPVVPSPKRTPFDGAVYADAEQELQAALEWAFERAKPGRRVVVAVENLAQLAPRLRRWAGNIAGSANGAFIGHGESIERLPGVRDLIHVLELGPRARWEALSATLRSASIAGAVNERGARAAFDRRLREQRRFELPLAFVAQSLAGHPELARFSELVQHLRAAHEGLPRRQRLVDWLRHFDACLTAVGWPGDDDAVERQSNLRALWAALSDRLAPLDAVLAPLSREQALGRVRRLVADTTQAASLPQHDVFVVTPLQALLIAPTHLWLSGADSGLLLKPRAAPLIPFAVQRDRGMPGADPALDLARARAIVEALAAMAGECRASYAAGDGDQQFLPSPLIPALAGRQREPQRARAPRHWQQPAAPLSTLTDPSGNALPAGSRVRGGVGFLSAQSACAFRAYARYRLTAKRLEEPRPGMSPIDKGQAVHAALAEFWGEVEDSTSLAALDDAARARAVDRAARLAVRPPPFETPLERAVSAIERHRVAHLLERWLTIELDREPFTVVSREESDEVEFGGLEFGVRIDRVDELDDGCRIVIDYKTGRCAVSDWQTPRMAEPQLPFYALAAGGEAVQAVAFAQLRHDELRWRQVPKAGEDASDWVHHAAQWRTDLLMLVDAIRAGSAAALPRTPPATCKTCDHALFCRLVEHPPLGVDGTTDDDD